jgi:hypothetical protein
MEKIIRISVQDITAFARLNDSETALAIWEALPLEGKANRWGEEIYFAIPLDLPEAQDARQEMDVGELGYWPTGNAFCVFFGPTPVSDSDKPRAYSNVNPFGRVQGDAKIFLKVKDGDSVRVEQAPGT